MYNTLFGANNMIKVCLELAGIEDLSRVERLRDAIVINEGDEYYIEVLTRTGGANRESYPNTYLKGNKQYIKDFDDDYDNTYAHYVFKSDEDSHDLARYVFENQSRKSLDLRTMFENELKQMEIPGTDAYKRAKQMARGIQRLAEKSDSNFEIITPDYLMKLGEEEDGE